jgi:bacteriocin-like protein
MKKIPTSTHTLGAPVELTEAELNKVSGGDPPFNASGKNPSGKKIPKFSNNPND